ncbi:hypothetical protein GCM10010495_69700 [Kitasatospora herbaricolor]|uniref:ABC-three component system protein n=1 Tax=Kitasatospora herbaricolor TaxID=68217 RepID=UPI00174DD887|nr:ABC-three component system protein [Kitasatospora herbaricolor]MDQ0313315.1 hypothetical protein [Kitasatospora herbaricolor]GGV42102.1 hypothetical protein GCM10010495_69700 [Kitasatospora herbaricolor]
MSTPQRLSYHAEPLFSEIPLPSQASVTEAPHMMGASLDITPVQRMSLYSGDQWEEFTLEWVLSLKAEREYVGGVMRLGGPNDRGADIVAFLSPDKTDGRWHCFQSKRYTEPLGVAKAYPEMLKILVAVAEGSFKTLPERYVFVAPNIGATFRTLLAKPERLKQEFLAALNKPGSRLGAEYDPQTLTAALKLAQSVKFSMFEAPMLAEIFAQHASTVYHASRFGRSSLTRPSPEKTAPVEHSHRETRYIEQLLEVYEQEWGCAPNAPAAYAHKRAGKDLRNQRVAFYCAEQLRVFARDSVPPRVFEDLQQEIHSYVDRIVDRYDTGYTRLNAATDAACQLQLRQDGLLINVIEHQDRAGICHQLANDDKLIWCEKDENL